MNAARILDRPRVPSGLTYQYPAGPTTSISVSFAAAAWGAWVELVPAGTFAQPIVALGVYANANNAAIVRLATGASGSEVVVGHALGDPSNFAHALALPVLIPAGVRVAASGHRPAGAVTADNLSLLYALASEI
jgi:hypothetical protein